MQTHLREILRCILDSYRNTGGINNIDGLNLPSKRAMESVCEELLQILFPGFLDAEPVHSSDMERVIGYRLGAIADRLKHEICRALRTDNPDCSENRAEEITLEFLATIPEVRDLLRTDVQAAYEGDPAARSFEEIILAYPCVEAIAIQRLAHRLYLKEVPLIPRMMTEWAHARTGIDIHAGASLGSHFFIDHGTGVVIGETSRIGSRVKLYHGVTLGAKSFAKDDEGHILKGGKRHPDVGDDVTIYPGSTVLGGETVIGGGTTLGGNVFLMHSVPPNSLVYYEETQIKVVPKRRDRSADGENM